MYKNYYVPILKWKRGEQIAVENLDSATKEKLLPLIEIPPIDWDWENDRPKKSIDEHISNVSSSISTHFSTSEVFLDLINIEEEQLLCDGRHSIERILEECINLNVNIIPVIGLNRSREYLTEIHNLLNEGTLEKVCIRVEECDFTNLNSRLEDVLENLSICASQCHLVIDLKEKSVNNIPTYEIMLPIIINNLISLREWISITLASTSFPKTLEQVSRNSYRLLPKFEYRLWNNLIHGGQLLREIQFGDYCIANPEYSEVDPRIMAMSGNLRYTIDDYYLVYKGVNVRINGFNQMIDICNQLLSSSYYMGETFSWGDRYIYDVVNRGTSTGNAETWRRVGTNHHISYVVSQLSNQSYF